MIDLPFSIIADTLFLSYTAFHTEPIQESFVSKGKSSTLAELSAFCDQMLRSRQTIEGATCRSWV
ncbi:YceK/YidQ family lipoprotein [Pseudomonas sp. B329]|uniref:YceK/YidQ family lipoprotein n=1 Tax=Pseudomonas sp. B329 TaxID=1553459 RepID=UPI0020063443